MSYTVLFYSKKTDVLKVYVKQVIVNFLKLFLLFEVIPRDHVRQVRHVGKWGRKTRHLADSEEIYILAFVVD